MPRIASTTGNALTISRPRRLVLPQIATPMILNVSVNEAALFGNGNYLKIGRNANVEVDWGDGTVETVVTPSEGFVPLAFHRYAATGPYTVTITGSLPQFGDDSSIGIGTGFGQDFITEVVQWNSTTTNFSWAFEDEDQLVSVPSTLPAGVTNTTGMFRGCTSLSANDKIYTGILNTDYTSNGFADTFNNGEFYLSLQDLSPSFSSILPSLDNSVKIIAYTNKGVVSGPVTFVNIPDTGFANIYFTRDQFGAVIRPGTGQDQILSVSFVSTASIFNNWDVSAVTNMRMMFYDCNNAEFNPYLGDWDTSNVINMQEMFSGSTSFEGLGLERWNTDSVSVVEYMFAGASNFNAGIGTWNVSNVTSFYNMFSGATEFNQPLGSWDVSSAIDMRSMFENASTFNQKIGGWDVSSVIDMSNMFNGATAFAGNLKGWSVPNIVSTPSDFGASNAVPPIWGSTQTAFVATITGGGAYILAQIANFNSPTPYGFDVRIDWGDGTASTSFNDENGFIEHNYSSTGTYTMTVSGCWEASSAFGGIPIGFGDGAMTSVSSFNSTMISANYLFENRIGLLSVPDTLPPSIIDTSNMFYGCINFNDPNVSLWDVGNVVSMFSMFQSAQSFNQDLTGWCVTTQPSEPFGFADDSALELSNRPVWGTCPTPVSWTSPGTLDYTSFRQNSGFITAVSAVTRTGTDSWSVLGNSQANVAYSTDDGTIWSYNGTNVPDSVVKYGLASKPGGNYVTVGLSARLWYSSNGISWTNLTTTINTLVGGAVNMGGIVYGGTRFVATPAQGSGKPIYSTDGVTWQMSATGSLGLKPVWTGTQYLYQQVSSSQIWSSSDGITWATAFTTPNSSTAFGVMFANPLGTILWVNGSTIFVRQGSSWSTGTSLGRNTNCIFWAKNRWWFIGAQDSGSAGVPVAFTSFDGATWTQSTEFSTAWGSTTIRESSGIMGSGDNTEIMIYGADWATPTQKLLLGQ